MTDPTALKRLPVAAVCDEHVRATPARSARSRTHIGPVLRPRRSRRRVGSASSRKLSVSRPMTPRSNAIAACRRERDVVDGGASGGAGI